MEESAKELREAFKNHCDYIAETEAPGFVPDVNSDNEFACFVLLNYTDLPRVREVKFLGK